jgi:NitT/TauT family transport system ATP-binding protein
MQITVRSLTHAYPQRGGTPLVAVQDVDLDVRSGEFVALIGPSGCGKSTLLRVLSGLLEPAAGTVKLNGEPPREMVAVKRIAWLAQNPALLPWKTVRENIALAQRINPQNHRTLHPIDDLLNLVSLADFADAYPHTLSGGMQQRVALARTLALGADLWLMDEPFAALDELTREQLTQEVLRLWAGSGRRAAVSDDRSRAQPATVIWVTHHIYEAVRLADRVLVMTPRPGRIAAEIPVGLPRPRDDRQPEFQAAVAELRALLMAAPHVP